MTVIFLLSLFFLCSSLISMTLKQKHIIILLLSLEVLMMSCFILISPYIFLSMYELLIIFLILVVCEACLGMSLLVVICFFWGNDMIKNFNLMNN